MANNLYNNINAFSLYTPSLWKGNMINRNENNQDVGNINKNKEYIEITKNVNSLPTVKLRSYVLYYRNSGDWIQGEPNTGETVTNNYRFYNNIQGFIVNSEIVNSLRNINGGMPTVIPDPTHSTATNPNSTPIVIQSVKGETTLENGSMTGIRDLPPGGLRNLYEFTMEWNGNSSTPLYNITSCEVTSIGTNGYRPGDILFFTDKGVGSPSFKNAFGSNCVLKVKADIRPRLKKDVDELMGSILSGQNASATAGTYTNVALTTNGGAPGQGGALATVVTTATQVTGVTITLPGSDYSVGDELVIAASDIGRTTTDLEFQLVAGDIDTDNYLEYKADGRQLGWIWGFPLFDINSNNWPRWKSCIDGNYIGSLPSSTGFGNQQMLVDISTNNQNIIVLDMSNYGGNARAVAGTYSNISLNSTTGSGSGALATVITTNKQVTSIQITPNGGLNYTAGNIVNIKGEDIGRHSGEDIVFTLKQDDLEAGGLSEVQNNFMDDLSGNGTGYANGNASPSTGYQNIPTTVSTGVGSGAVATINTNVLSVNGITITNGGSGYNYNPTSPETLIISGNNIERFANLKIDISGNHLDVKKGPFFTVDISDCITSGLTETATAGTYNVSLTTTSGSGSGAVVDVVTSATQIESITVTTTGNNYMIGDVLEIAFGSIGRTQTNVQLTIASYHSSFINGYSLSTTTNAMLPEINPNVATATHEAGTYTGVAITTVTGSGNSAIATVITSENSVESITITTAGSGYAVDDELKIAGNIFRFADLKFKLVSSSIVSGGLNTATDSLLDSVASVNETTAYFNAGIYNNLNFTVVSVTNGGSGGQANIEVGESGVVSIKAINTGNSSNYVVGDIIKINGYHNNNSNTFGYADIILNIDTNDFAYSIIQNVQNNLVDHDTTGMTSRNDGFIDISGNIPGVSDAFYMTLRVKDSSENAIIRGGQSGAGNNGNWRVYPRNPNNGSSRTSNWWCTLIEYTFECDLIGPKSMLDFSPSIFTLYDASNNESRILSGRDENNYVKNYVYAPDYNNFTQNNTNKILTGSGKTYWTASNPGMKKTMSPSNVILGLTLHKTSTNKMHKHLQVYSAWDSTSNKESKTLLRLIGSMFNDGDSDSNTQSQTGYYGPIQNPGTDRTTKYAQTSGWKNDISIWNLGRDNIMEESNFNNASSVSNKSFNLNNVLWASIKSPRKIKITYIGKQNILLGKNRFVPNFLDLSGENDCYGGGYGRYTNTIDLPRRSINPYYAAKHPVNNTALNANTVDISGFDVDKNINYYGADKDNALNVSDISGFIVYYKLLIPPKNTEEYTISYTFNKTNNIVTTFFRYNGMDGTPDPVGSDNRYATRDSNDKITLTWNAGSLQSNGEMPTKKIIFFDVASGFNKVSATITNSGILEDATDGSEDFDISFNVFQLHFFSRNVDNTITNYNLNEVPYTVKTLDNNTQMPQIIDISYVPTDYEPYRYNNYSIYNNINYDSFCYFDNSVFPSSQLYTRAEKLVYDVQKIFTRDVIKNADIIEPSNNKIFPSVFIDFAAGGGMVDQSYNFVPTILDSTIISNNQGEEIASFDFDPNHPDNRKFVITNNDTEFILQNGAIDGIYLNNIAIPFIEPNIMKLQNFFIPDFWRLPKKINELRTRADNGTSTYPYVYFNSWMNQIRTSMVFDILSISLRSQNGSTNNSQIGSILINSHLKHKGSSQYMAVTLDGKLVDNNVSNIVYDVQGALTVPPADYLNLSPIVVRLKTISTGPFGNLGVSYIGNRETGVGGINVPYPDQFDSCGNLIIAGNNSKFVVNTVLIDSFRHGNNESGGDLAVESGYNGVFEINEFVSDSDVLLQNQSFKNTIISPDPLPILTVELDNTSIIIGNNGYIDMLDDSNQYLTIEWTGFPFSRDPSWNFQDSDMYWTIERVNLNTLERVIKINEEQIVYYNNKYQWIDNNITIYDKYRYVVTGKFKWTGITSRLGATSEIPYLLIDGFTTPDVFVCKHNRFPYGRYNTTSTNLKLFRPLLLTSESGQVDQHGKKIGGVCSDASNNNIYSRTSRISSSNNIYSNTSNQVSKKETYVIMSKSRFRPDR